MLLVNQSAKLKTLNQNHLLVTVVWDVWLHVSSILCQHLASTVKVLVLTTTVVSSNKSSKITNKMQNQTTGLKINHGWYQLISLTMFHSKTLLWKSRLDRLDILGYKKETKNYLNLFDINGVDYGLIDKGITFDQDEIQKNLTLFLYPDDSTRKGELLRIYQQYFMVSNAAQLLIDGSYRTWI